MLRRRVTGLVLAAALLIPTISTAAQNHRAPMTSWWKSLITWVAHVTGYATDPTCPPAPFTDVPCTTPFEPFIKELVTLGVTAGCGVGTYCPQTTVTRAQMAIFLSVFPTPMAWSTSMGPPRQYRD